MSLTGTKGRADTGARGPATADRAGWLRLLPVGALVSAAGAAQLARATLGPLDAYAVAHLPVLCPLRRLTGIACPTCGLGRSLLAILGGDLPGAFTHHPLGPLLLLATLASALAFALRPARVELSLRSIPNAVADHPILASTLLALYATWGFTR